MAHQCHNTGLRSDEPVDSGCVKFNMPVTRLELLGPCGIVDLQLKKYVELIAQTTATCPNDLLEDTENEDAKNIKLGAKTCILNFTKLILMKNLLIF